MRGIDRRLRTLEQRTAATDTVGKIVVFCPEDWPAEVQAAYNRARNRGDVDTADDIIEQMTGERPVRGPGHVFIIENHRPAGL